MEKNQNNNFNLNNRIITDPTAMSNVFNKYFTSITDKTNSNIKCSPKHYTDYLYNTNTNTFFLTPTDKNKHFKTTEKWYFSTIK